MLRLSNFKTKEITEYITLIYRDTFIFFFGDIEEELEFDDELVKKFMQHSDYLNNYVDKNIPINKNKQITAIEFVKQNLEVMYQELKDENCFYTFNLFQEFLTDQIAKSIAELRYIEYFGEDNFEVCSRKKSIIDRINELYPIVEKQLYDYAFSNYDDHLSSLLEDEDDEEDEIELPKEDMEKYQKQYALLLSSFLLLAYSGMHTLFGYCLDGAADVAKMTLMEEMKEKKETFEANKYNVPLIIRENGDRSLFLDSTYCPVLWDEDYVLVMELDILNPKSVIYTRLGKEISSSMAIGTETYEELLSMKAIETETKEEYYPNTQFYS